MSQTSEKEVTKNDKLVKKSDKLVKKRHRSYYKKKVPRSRCESWSTIQPVPLR